MDLKDKEIILIQLAKEILSSDVIGDELNFYLNKLNCNQNHFIKKFCDFDLIPNKEDNKVYDDLLTRLIMYSKQYIITCHHHTKQKYVLETVKKLKPQKIIDLGFGTPGKYSLDYVLKNDNISLELVDLFPISFDFAKLVFEYHSNAAKDKIHFITDDLNKYKYLGNHDLYIFMDSIEHFTNATEYLHNLASDIRNGDNLIFTLPIAMGYFPSHTMEWANDLDAIKWLKKSGLTIIETKPIYLNPKGDVWAIDIYDLNKFHILFVHCKK